jgi:hypothetical protein
MTRQPTEGALANDIRQKALAYLQTNPVRHLVHLKYLSLYADSIDLDYVEQGSSVGVMLSHPTDVISWDAAAYPQTARVFLPTTSDEMAAGMLVNLLRRDFIDERPTSGALVGATRRVIPTNDITHLVSGRTFVCKFCDTMTTSVFARAFPLRFVRAFLSYTTQRIGDDWATDGVLVEKALNPACVPLYVANGYTEMELQKLFAEGALSFTLYEADGPVCTCIAYPNFDTIWEIGGVRTVERARRKGLALRVVGTALKTLLEQGRTPRYQVEGTNLASVKLAAALGLTPCLRFEHYLAEMEAH